MVRLMAAVVINQPDTSKIDQNDLIYFLHAHRTHSYMHEKIPFLF